MTSDRFRIHLISGNSPPRDQRKSYCPKDRRQLLKYAAFYLVVAAILVTINNTSKTPMAGAVQLQSAADQKVNLFVTRKLQPNRLVGDSAAMGAYVVRFRLTNQGYQPIFYAAFPGTHRPIGQIVYRISSEADWRPRLAPELSRSAPPQQYVNVQVAWIEMPPGGWADGEYDDAGFPAGEHAYEMDVKFASDGKVTPLISNAYPAGTN